MEKYSKEELWDLYEQLPKDLQGAIFSEEIGKKVEEILKENNVKSQEKVLNIIKGIGYVFLGLISPNELKENILKKEFKIKESDAEKIFSAINNEIFSELKNSLEALYEIKIEVPEKTPIKSSPPKKDTYREPIE